VRGGGVRGGGVRGGGAVRGEGGGGRRDYQQAITEQENATRRTGIARSQRIQTKVAQEMVHDILEELKNISSLCTSQRKPVEVILNMVLCASGPQSSDGLYCYLHEDGQNVVCRWYDLGF